MTAASGARLWVLAAMLLLAGPAVAELSASLQQVRPSVVAIGTYQKTRSPAFRFLGTGFAIEDGRRIVTNAHVVPALLDPEKFETLVVAVPGGPERAEIREATPEATDGAHDLALLRIGGSPLPAVQLAGDELAAEGIDIAFTGFPIGSALGLTPVTHRGIIAAVTPISIPQGNSRRLDARLVRSLADGPLMVYQLDATAYPGNSGSPLYDASTGRVLGVINMVFVKKTKENVLSDPSGITYAIPVRYLRALLQ